MTKKDYILIAKVFKKTFDYAQKEIDTWAMDNLKIIVQDFCHVAKEDNNKFNETTFKKAVGFKV